MVVSDEEFAELFYSTKIADRYSSVATSRDIIHRLVEEDRKRNSGLYRCPLLYLWQK